MTDSSELYQQAVRRLSDGDPQQAEQQLRRLLAAEPNHPDALALLGHSLQQQGRLQAAIAVFSQQVAQFPASAQAHAELAGAQVAAGQLQQAEAAYRKAVEVQPQYSEGWFLLGNLLMQQGQTEQARHSFARAERCDPFGPVFSQVQQAMQQKQYHQAETLCREVLRSHGHHPLALHTLATLAEQVGAFEEALNILQHGLQYAPYHVSLIALQVKNLVHCGHQSLAVDAAKRLVTLQPDRWQYHKILAVELANAGRFEESLAAYQQALALEPGNANLHLLQGHVLKTLGRRSECEQAYRRSLALQRDNGTAWWALADLKSYRFSDEDMAELQRLMGDPSIAAEQRSQAAFTLAKAQEDRGNYPEAFATYLEANELRPDVRFEPEFYRQSCEAVQRGFSQHVLSQQAEKSKDPVTPIFIVGLTRSGSTLLEQILASHPLVDGTMELYSMPRTVRRAERLARQKGLDYPKAMARFSPAELQALGQGYLDETAVYRSGKPYFIDKMPPNFHNVGFIHMVLPHAVIIDARRHPLAAGFSNFKQHFARGYDFSYKLGDIGFYYNQYLQMMDYWDDVLPNKVLCMQYEQVVRDTEQQVRRLLDHCGLAFDPACLSFYANRRAVRTASSEQVRQPIYRQGIDQWQHFEANLQPLKNALGETTLQRFAAFL